MFIVDRLADLGELFRGAKDGGIRNSEVAGAAQHELQLRVEVDPERLREVRARLGRFAEFLRAESHSRGSASEAH